MWLVDPSMDSCNICRNNNNGMCRLDWGCCFDPNPALLDYLNQLGKMFGDD